ncbi:MAG TPA: transposase, partial [Polyangia bacterium]
MTRPLRFVAPGLPHHVILRGNNRRRLFSYPSDYQRFLYYLERGLRDVGCWMHAAALMTNHVHLILSPPDRRALSDCVRAFSQRYAQYRNRRKNASGKLFEQRFAAFPILHERQLAVTTVYVDLNPQRAG